MRKFAIYTINLLLLFVAPALVAQIFGFSAQNSSTPSSSFSQHNPTAFSNKFSDNHSLNLVTPKLEVRSFSSFRKSMKNFDLSLKASLTSTGTYPFSNDFLQNELQVLDKEQWCLKQPLAFVQSFSS